MSWLTGCVQNSGNFSRVISLGCQQNVEHLAWSERPSQIDIQYHYPMNIRWLASSFLVVGFSLSAAIYALAQSAPSPEQQALTLRKSGPTGLQTFLKQHQSILKNSTTTLPPEPFRKTLDSLCRQRDCYASQLYWYTDLDQAKAAAQVSGKPILSLRLLGQLDQELSCANSRFFRVALYPNAKISQVLHDRFILHWESVRPAPKVTVDFGDGRKLERTITGNSIHYILDAAGQPIEAIPGLYGPQAFLKQLLASEKAVQTYRQSSNRKAFLRQYHRDRLMQLERQWTVSLNALGIAIPRRPAVSPIGPVGAEIAAQSAMTKMAVEAPLVSSLRNLSALAEITDRAAWKKLAQSHRGDAVLDGRSINLMRAKQVGQGNEQVFKTLVQQFEFSMALDTVRNEYLLHSQLHRWFMEGAATQSVNQLNDRVYAELFLTPKTDPWLGLAPTDVYSAIEKDGLLGN